MLKNNIRIVPDRGLDFRTQICCIKFFKWLRVRFIFPHKLTIFIMNQSLVKSLHGDKVYGASCFPEEKTSISIDCASRIRYSNDCSEIYEKLTGILYSIAHEVGHYFEWTENVEIDIQELDDKFADEYATYILDLYLPTHEYLYPGVKNSI